MPPVGPGFAAAKFADAASGPCNAPIFAISTSYSPNWIDCVTIALSQGRLILE
jgi:hypothetical protein